MTDRITPKLSAAATTQAAQWLDDAPRTTVRSIIGATNKKNDAMRMFIKLETGAVIAMDEAQVDWVETNIKKTRQAHEVYLSSRGLKPPHIKLSPQDTNSSAS